MHWGRILRNVLSNWTSYFVSAAVGFVLAPVVVHSLGNTGYGLWTLILSMTGYFGLLDLGIRSSVGRFVTRHLALKDDVGVNRTTSTAFAVLASAGMVAFLATLAIAAFLMDHFKVEPQYAAAARIALVITGFNMSCMLPLGVFSSLLFGLERFDVVSGITIVSELTRATLVVWSLRNGYGLVALALISLALTILQYSAAAICAKRLYPRLKIRLRYVDRKAIRELFGFSIYRFVWIVANQLIFYSDSVVIGIYLGAGAITPYAIAGSLINYGRNIVGLVVDTLGPSATRMDAHEDLAGLQRVLILGTRISLFLAVPLCLGYVFLGQQFIGLWMGKAYMGSAIFLTVLTIPQFGSMSQYASALVLAAMARHRAFAYFALAEGVANLVLSVILVQKIGLIGVAWGTVIPDLICTTVVVPIYTLHVLKLSVREYLAKAFLRPMLCAIPVAGVGYALSTVECNSWLMFASEAMGMCAVFGVLAYFVCLDRGQRSAVAGKLVSMLRREAVANNA